MDERERYAEWEQEQDAYEQARYDDELSKAHDEIKQLKAKLARVEKLPEKWRRESKLDPDSWPAEDCADELRQALEQDD